MKEKLNAFRVVFAGTPEFSVPCLQALIDSPLNVVAVYTQPDRNAGRGLKVKMSPVKALALSAGIPVEQPNTLKADSELFKLKSYRPHIIIVVAYGLILPLSVLKVPSYGCLNVHASLLPRWRGASPIQHAILSGDAESGISYMLMNAGLDTGPIIAQRSLLIKPSWTSRHLHDALAALGAKYLVDTVYSWVNNELIVEEQEEETATKAPKIKKEDGNIDWRQSAKEIQHRVNAFNPWPIAYSYLNGELVRVYAVSVMASDAVAEPGTILNVNKSSIDVACGHQILCLTECQLAGGKVLPVAEILKSKSEWFKPGNQFSRQP